jgi:hypothetical protein
MATVQGIQSDIASKTAESDRLFNESTALYEKGQVLSNQLSALIRQSRVGLSPEQIANITSQQDALRLEIRTVTDQEESLARAGAQLAREVKQLEFDLKKAQQDEAAKEAELDNTPGSAGSGAPTQSPELPTASVNERLNTQQAAALAGETETGTNPPVKKLTETQSVSPDDSNADPGVITSPYYAPGTGANTADPSPPTAGGAPGVGATGEDGATATNTTRILNSFNKKTFAPKGNVLDQYASYTYNIGWYLLKPDAYAEMQKSHKPVLSNYSLLIQSGGAASDFGDIKNNIVGRSPFFKNDFYLDNLKIQSVITGKGSNKAHNSASLEFTVTEPANITLIDNLWKAVNDQYKDQDPTNRIPYRIAAYALVIRFYGYNDDGKLVQAGNNGVVVEKIIPFQLSDITFTVANKLVEYTVKGTPIPYQIGFGSNLGAVKSSVKISGATVKDLLTNGVVLAEVSPSDGRKTAPSPATYGSATTNNGITNTNNEGGSFGDGGLDTSDSLIGA